MIKYVFHNTDFHENAFCKGDCLNELSHLTLLYNSNFYFYN